MIMIEKTGSKERKVGREGGEKREERGMMVMMMMARLWLCRTDRFAYQKPHCGMVVHV